VTGFVTVSALVATSSPTSGREAHVLALLALACTAVALVGILTIRHPRQLLLISGSRVLFAFCATNMHVVSSHIVATGVVEGVVAVQEPRLRRPAGDGHRRPHGHRPDQRGRAGCGAPGRGRGRRRPAAAGHGRPRRPRVRRRGRPLQAPPRRGRGRGPPLPPQARPRPGCRNRRRGARSCPPLTPRPSPPHPDLWTPRRRDRTMVPCGSSSRRRRIRRRSTAPVPSPTVRPPVRPPTAPRPTSSRRPPPASPATTGRTASASTGSSPTTGRCIPRG